MHLISSQIKMKCNLDCKNGGTGRTLKSEENNTSDIMMGHNCLEIENFFLAISLEKHRLNEGLKHNAKL